MNGVLRFLLLVWLFGYLALSCGPLLVGDATAGGLGLLVGGVLFVPWLVGVLVLVILVWLTNPGR